MLGAQLVQRLGDEFAAQEGAGRQDEHRHAGQAEPLGRDGGAEVRLVPHHDVRPPFAGDVQQGTRALPAAAACEQLLQLPVVPCRVDGRHRHPDRRARVHVRGGTRGDRREPGPFDRRDLPPGRRDGHGVPGRRHGPRDGRHRVEVPTAAGEGEEKAHSRQGSGWRSDAPHPFPRPGCHPYGGLSADWTPHAPGERENS